MLYNIRYGKHLCVIHIDFYLNDFLFLKVFFVVFPLKFLLYSFLASKCAVINMIDPVFRI